MDYENLSPGNRHGLKERLDLLQVQVRNILGDNWRVEKVRGRRRILHLVGDPGNLEDDEANDPWLNACAVLWDYRGFRGFISSLIHQQQTTSLVYFAMATARTKTCGVYQ